MNKKEQYTLHIFSHLQQLFQEDCENYIEIIPEDDDLTLFFHCLTAAGCMLFNRITGNDFNMLKFNQLQNSLCFQYANEKEVEVGD